MKNFVEKSAEELAALDVNGLASYLKEKAAFDREQLNTLIESKATPEQIEAVKAALNEKMDDE